MSSGIDQVFGARLRMLRMRQNLTMRELAERAFISYNYVRSMESGAKGAPATEVVIRLAEILDVTVDQLLGRMPVDGEVSPTASTATVRAGSDVGATGRAGVVVAGTLIPLRGRVPADGLRWTEGYAGRAIEVTPSEIAGAQEPFAVEATGDCLASLGIRSGDTVILDRPNGRTPRSGQLALVRIGDEMTLKLWCPIAGGVELRNGAGEVVRTLSPGDDIEVVGLGLTYKPGKRW